MIKIALAGGPGAGKTSLARHLVSRLYNDMHVNTQYVTEFARDYISECLKHGGFDCTMGDQLMIYNEQKKKEDIIPKETVVMVTDCPMFINLYYAYNCVNPNDRQATSQYMNVYQRWLQEDVDNYDHIFFVEREGFALDGMRLQTESEAKRIDNGIKGFLDFHQIPFDPISGSYDSMVEFILQMSDIADCKTNKEAR